MNPDVPKGRRFSHLYVEKGDPTEDSTRVRLRLGAAVVNGFDNVGLRNYLARELGVDVPGSDGWLFGEQFFTQAELRDVLDAITLTYKRLATGNVSAQAQATAWLVNARRILQEENSTFELDDEGGVHRSVDPLFAGMKAATIGALSGPRYRNSLVEFESAMADLDRGDGKQAIRRTFSSAEGLFKLMYSGVPRLGPTELKARVKPVLDRIPDLPERQASLRMLDAFCDWSDGAQFYRHEDGKPEPSQPSLQLAILMVSQGAGYIRWLAERDRQDQQQ